MKMQRYIGSFYAVLMIFLTFSTVASAQSIHLPQHEKVILKNGLTVLLMEKHGVPIVSFAAIIKAGAAADPSGQAGLASMTAGLLRKGTQKRTAQQFAADLDYIGGSFEAYAETDFTSVTAEFLNKDLARGLDLVSDALLHPAFPQAEADKLLAQSLDAVKGAKDDPQSVLKRYYLGYLYGTHAYAHPVSGDEISIKNIQRNAVIKFYETYYTPGNTILAVSGDFNKAEMKKKLQEVLGTWQAKQAPVVSIAPAESAKGNRLLLIDKPDATQTYFAFGNIGTAANDPDRAAILLVNTIFGGRFTSILNEALRVESGLTYGVRSSFDGWKVPGPFIIRSFTKNESTVQAVDLSLKVLEDLHKNGLTAQQLDSAKSYIKGQFPPTIETSEQLAQLIATNEFYGLDDNEVNQLEARIDAVTPEIAKQVIQKHFPLDNLVFVLIGKASDIKSSIQKYAKKQDMRMITDPGFWPPSSPK